jgi:hypothetical protein
MFVVTVELIVGHHEAPLSGCFPAKQSGSTYFTTADCSAKRVLPRHWILQQRTSVVYDTRARKTGARKCIEVALK